MSLRLLTPGDLSDLCYTIEDVTADWITLGMNLKIPVSRLKAIETAHKHDVGRCKMEMLTLWLNMDTAATWESLASALERLKMNRLADNIRRQRLPEYAESASNGGFGDLRDRSGGSTLVMKSTCWASEEQLVTPTQLHKGNPSDFRKQSVNYSQPKLHALPASSPDHAASNGSFSMIRLQTNDHVQPSTSADSDPLFFLPDGTPSIAVPFSASSPELLKFTPNPSFASPGSPTKPSSVSDTCLTTNPIPAAPSDLPTPIVTGSSSAPVRPSTISIGQSTENLQTTTSRRLSTTPAACKQQNKKKQSLKNVNEVTAAENKRIDCLRRHFAYLVNAILDILQNEECTDVYQVQVLVQQLPISCSDPQRVLEPQERLDIQRATSISHIFSILSGEYLTYENFGLLESIAQTFCYRRAKPLLEAYMRDYRNPGCTGHSPLQQIITEEGQKLAKRKESFANLVVKIMRILEEVGLNLLQLSVYIRSSTVKRLYHQDRENLKHPESVSHIFSIIIRYIEYDSYDLLRCIVKRFGNDRTKRMMRRYKQKFYEQLDTTRSSHTSDEDDGSSFTSDGRSSILTNHTLASCSSQSRTHFSSEVEEDSTRDCSAEDLEQQQHCSQEAASQETLSAVDTLSGATVSTHQTNADDAHSAATVSTNSHSVSDDTMHSTATFPINAHQLSNDLQSTATASTGSHLLPLTDRSVSDSLPLSQRVCCSDNSSYLLAVTNRASSSTATSSLSAGAVNTSPHIQTVVVKTYFTPWDKEQIHVRPRQKVKVDTRYLTRVRSGKNETFIDVLTESGREGKVPVSVLDISSLPAASISLSARNAATHDHTSLQQTRSDRASISSSNGYCAVSDSDYTAKRHHAAHTFERGKTNSQNLKANKLVTAAAPTLDVSMGRKHVTWSHDTSSTVLPSPRVRPQSLPIPVSSSPQDSPQSEVVKLPKKSRTRKFLSHIKGFFVRSSETVYTVDELRADDAYSNCTVLTSPKMELELGLNSKVNFV